MIGVKISPTLSPSMFFRPFRVYYLPPVYQP